jgi:hypothetical protein
MDDSLRNAFRFSPSRLVLVGLVFVLAALPATVGAAPIEQTQRTNHDTVHLSHQLRVLERFLAGGPEHWEATKPPKVPAGISITTADGQLKDNAFTEFLSWERDKDPQRFDARHPKVASLLAQATNLLGTDPPLDPPVSSAAAVNKARTSVSTPQLAAEMLVAPSPVPSAPQLGAEMLVAPSPVPSAPQLGAEMLVAPSPVPEPSSVVVGALLCGSFALWRGWKAER